MEGHVLGPRNKHGRPEGGAGKVKARERMAVLAALNLAYQLAERPAAAPSPAAAAAAPTAPGVDVDALVRRIDAVLQDDGLLI